MKIIKTYYWSRRDFVYDAKCEFCKMDRTGINGYDDDNYYNNVLPEKECLNCGKSTKKDGQVEKITPKYPSS